MPAMQRRLLWSSRRVRCMLRQLQSVRHGRLLHDVRCVCVCACPAPQTDVDLPAGADQRVHMFFTSGSCMTLTPVPAPAAVAVQGGSVAPGSASSGQQTKVRACCEHVSCRRRVARARLILVLCA